MDEQQLKLFLDRIAELESNRGKNLEHKELSSGIHKGEAAVGKYGLMPNTINEFAKRSGHPELSDMDSLEKRQYLENNPDIEEALANTLGRHVLERQGGNEEKAAFSWLRGHNLPSEEVEKRGYKEDPYVQKYQKLSPKKEEPFYRASPEEFNKLRKYLGER